MENLEKEKWLKSNDGDGYGDGSGSGSGSGYGYGYGDGDGDGDLEEYNGETVDYIDGIPCILRNTSGDFALVDIVNKDFSTTKAYVAKGNGLFAHGRTLKDAHRALQEKITEKLPLEDRILQFTEIYPSLETIAENRDLFSWHHILTGSCEFGRRKFAEERGIDVENGTMTVAEFIRITADQYGGECIRKLKDAYTRQEPT